MSNTARRACSKRLAFTIPSSANSIEEKAKEVFVILELFLRVCL